MPTGAMLRARVPLRGAIPRSSRVQHEQRSHRHRTRLEDWQKASDERLWKLIVSPEFGDRVDLKRLTRDLMSEMQTDLATPLEW